MSKIEIRPTKADVVKALRDFANHLERSPMVEIEKASWRVTGTIPSFVEDVNGNRFYTKEQNYYYSMELEIYFESLGPLIRYAQDAQGELLK